MNTTDVLQWALLVVLAIAWGFLWAVRSGDFDYLRSRINGETDYRTKANSEARYLLTLLEWRVDALARALGWKYIPEGRALATWVKDEDEAPPKPERGRK